MSKDLSARVRALEDRIELLELEGQYSRFFDDHDGDAWSGLFTPDGIYQSRDAGATFVQGRAALKDFCDNAPFDGLHLFHLPQVTILDGTATARIHLEYRGVWPRDPGAPQVNMVGYYDVAYTRVDKTWLISRRVTTTFSREQSTTIGYPSGSGLDARATEREVPTAGHGPAPAQ
ncbi:nuclear transport factor 2 family protein [Tomitella biformata]|uniref:nuclear transport factor 2 family protein n=1 Tax=Tomitella biformata TaxID=630403 RepID=UPI0004634FC4|nr:nuclear transport factor 2 family protein [Tomitella biformata]